MHANSISGYLPSAYLQYHRNASASLKHLVYTPLSRICHSPLSQFSPLSESSHLSLTQQVSASTAIIKQCGRHHAGAHVDVQFRYLHSAQQQYFWKYAKQFSQLLQVYNSQVSEQPLVTAPLCLIAVVAGINYPG